MGMEEVYGKGISGDLRGSIGSLGIGKKREKGCV